MRLKKQIQDIMTQYNVHSLCTRPQVSHILYKVDMGSEDNKNVYSNIIGRDTNNVCTIRDKWSESLNDEVFLTIVQTALTNAK